MDEQDGSEASRRSGSASSVRQTPIVGMEARSIKRIYFLAVCGTAMASLAALLKQMGYHVYGSDSGVYPPMSTFLQDQGIPVFDGFDPAYLDPAPSGGGGQRQLRGNVEVEELLGHIPMFSSGCSTRVLHSRTPIRGDHRHAWQNRTSALLAGCWAGRRR